MWNRLDSKRNRHSQSLESRSALAAWLLTTPLYLWRQVGVDRQRRQLLRLHRCRPQARRSLDSDRRAVAERRVHRAVQPELPRGKSPGNAADETIRETNAAESMIVGVEKRSARESAHKSQDERKQSEGDRGSEIKLRDESKSGVDVQTYAQQLHQQQHQHIKIRRLRPMTTNCSAGDRLAVRGYWGGWTGGARPGHRLEL